MRVRNVHERTTTGDAALAAALLDSVGTRRDRLWPRDRWPAMILDAEKAAGGRGGHGPIRYHATAYEPGQRIVFEFDDAGLSRGLRGVHYLELEVRDGLCTLRHSIDAELAGRALLLWLPLIRPLHDALIEDALDGFETAMGQPPEEPARYSWWVRALRSLLGLPKGRTRQRAASATPA